MTTFLKTFAATAAGLIVFGLSTANADHRDYRPDYCSINHDHRSHASNYYNYYPADDYYRPASYRPDSCSVDHDHRSHASNYYDHYPADRYSRAGAYDRSGVSFSIRLGDRGSSRYDRERHGHRGRHSYRGRGHQDRVVKRRSYDTRYRASIVLTESYVRGYRGHPQLVCTVRPYGPDARYVSERRMYGIARSECSRRARIQVYT